MIHQYKNNGYNIVLDVNSGSVHVVDDIVYDIIALYENNSEDKIIEELKISMRLKILRKPVRKYLNLKRLDSFLRRIYTSHILILLRTGLQL